MLLIDHYGYPTGRLSMGFDQTSLHLMQLYRPARPNSVLRTRMPRNTWPPFSAECTTCVGPAISDPLALAVLNRAA